MRLEDFGSKQCTRFDPETEHFHSASASLKIKHAVPRTPGTGGTLQIDEKQKIC